MNKKKQELEQILNTAENKALEEQLLIEYENAYPYDITIYSMQTVFWMKYGNYKKALETAKKAYKANHHIIENNYNLAYAYELCGDYVNAYRYYVYTQLKQKGKGITLISEEDLSKAIKSVESKLGGISDYEGYLKENSYFLLFDPFKQIPNTIIGRIIYLCDGKKYYVGNADNWFDMYMKDGTSYLSAFENRCELHEIDKIGTEYLVPGQSDEKFLLPVVPNAVEHTEQNAIAIIDGQRKASLPTAANQKYYYYLLHGGAKILSYYDAVFGKPIPLKYNSKKKRLVMSIFIDSLNGFIFHSKEFEDCITNIRAFFKDGCECVNAFAGSEFTYPSMASYVTGLTPERHQMLDSAIYDKLPSDVKIISELFKEQEYVTAKVGGNDATDSFLGYSRGMDRTVYQFCSQYPTEQIISDTIEQIETFQETNQYVWVELADLHDVAGGFTRGLYVQKNTDFEYLVTDEEESRKTTVKKGYSSNLKEIYKWELKKIDRNLGVLFDYINTHYTADEIVISLFSDHGTAFMVENEKPFLDRKRVHVPMLFKGGCTQGICTEYIETVDYGSILCHMCGFERDDSDLDGKLPKWFGGGVKEREYVYSRSLFPGDPYRAAIHSDSVSFYLDTLKPASAECTIDLSEYDVRAWNRDGEVLNKEELEKYTEIVERMVRKNRIY